MAAASKLVLFPLKVELEDSSRSQVFRSIGETSEGHGGFLSGSINACPKKLDLTKGSYDLELSFIPSNSSKHCSYPHPSLTQLKYHGPDLSVIRSDVDSPTKWRLTFSIIEGVIRFGKHEVGNVENNSIKLGPQGISVTVVKPYMADKCQKNILGMLKKKRKSSQLQEPTIKQVIQDRLEHERHRSPDLSPRLTASHITAAYTNDKDSKLELNRLRLRALLFKRVQEHEDPGPPPVKRICPGTGGTCDNQLPEFNSSEIDAALLSNLSESDINLDEIYELNDDNIDNDYRLELFASGESADIHNKRYKDFGDLEIMHPDEPQRSCPTGGWKMTMVSKFDHSGCKDKYSPLPVYPLFVTKGKDSKLIRANDKYPGLNQISRDSLKVVKNSFIFEIPPQDVLVLNYLLNAKDNEEPCLYITLFREIDQAFASGAVHFRYYSHDGYCSNCRQNFPPQTLKLDSVIWSDLCYAGSPSTAYKPLKEQRRTRRSRVRAKVGIKCGRCRSRRMSNSSSSDSSVEDKMRKMKI